jgi:transposase
VAYVRKPESDQTLKGIRAAVCNNDCPLLQQYPWLRTVPYDIRDGAVRDLIKAKKTTKALCKTQKKTFHWKRINFRAWRDFKDTVVLRARDWTRTKGVYVNVLNKAMSSNATINCPWPMVPEHDFRLKINHLGHIYLFIPTPLNLEDALAEPTSKLEKAKRVVSIDPGVRSFMTIYNGGDGNVVDWGPGDMSKLYGMCRRIDGLTSKQAALKKEHKKHQKYPKKHWRIRHAIQRVRAKLRNRVDEVHKKASKWLLQNHEVILLPHFQSARMAKKTTEGSIHRKIGRKTVRQMLTWSHYRFRQRLLNRAREFPGRHVIICDEDYTSKTCGECGHLNQMLGSNETFRCTNAQCNYIADRDINGARNVLLRYLTREL